MMCHSIHINEFVKGYKAQENIKEPVYNTPTQFTNAFNQLGTEVAVHLCFFTFYTPL